MLVFLYGVFIRGKSMTPYEREVMQMALETVEQIASADYRYWEELASLGGFERWARSRVNHIAEALRTALAQPEKIECSRVECGGNNGCIDICWKKKPQRKEWVGLTDDEYELMAEKRVTNYFFNTLDYAHDIEAKLKEKNGG